jgi:molybdate-binding protein
MKPNQEATQKNVDFIALINQEYSLVVDGKAADKLVRLLHDYETDPFAGRIEKAAGAVEKYAHALLINGQYLDIGFLFIRYSQLVIAEVKHF